MKFVLLAHKDTFSNQKFKRNNVFSLPHYQCTPARRARTVYQPGTETSRDPRASTLATDGGASGTTVSPKSAGTLSITLPYNEGTQITYETVYDIHSNSPACVIDLNASGFEVSRVSNTDVIHAKRSDVPHILKVSHWSSLQTSNLFEGTFPPLVPLNTRSKLIVKLGGDIHCGCNWVND